MSWIQENRFAAGLGGFTAVAAIGLLVWGVGARSKYSANVDAYKETSEKIDAAEKAPLYPNEAHLREKNSALNDYREQVEKLGKAFDAYRSGDLKNVDVAAFTADLKKTREDVVAALKAVDAAVPDQFFLGFEKYTKEAVKGPATGILNFEIAATAELFKSLAASKASGVLNVYRPLLEEEDGNTFDAKGKSARYLPLEITFNGTEASLRAFLSSLDDSKKFYYVIRTIKVANVETKAPSASSAKFKTEDAPASGGGADAGGGVGDIVLPGQDATPAPAAAASGGSDGRILMQVLGTEKLNVFLRLDIVQFLPAQPLPKN